MQMKYSPRYIILVAVAPYLTEGEIEGLKYDLGHENPKQDRKFLRIFKKYFDFERMVKEPNIWQDIWIYNYLEYEVKSKFLKKGLIAKYEKEIVLPSEKVYKDFLKLLDS